jgi:hypothetical protein
MRQIISPAFIRNFVRKWHTGQTLNQADPNIAKNFS